jgi:hypothetical protein
MWNILCDEYRHGNRSPVFGLGLPTVASIARSRGGICEALGGRYPVDREVLAADVRSLIEALAGAGLVEAT